MLNEWMHLAVNFSLTLSACVLAVAVLRPAVRWMGGPRAQYALWLAVPLCLLAWRLPAPPVALPLAPAAVHQPIAEWRRQATEFLHEPAPPPAANGMPQRAAPRSALQQVLLGAWLLGCAGLCLLLLRQHRRWFRRLVWQPDAARWRLPAGHSPAVVGWWKPKLALPDDFAEHFTAEEQALVLAHEAVHARRRDSLWNAFATVLCVLQWFNPLAWWALRRFQRDQELACDAAALAALPATQRRPYWDALLKAHELSPSSALARGWRSAHPLIERLRWVQHGVQGRIWASVALVPALALAMSGVVYATHGAAVDDLGLHDRGAVGLIEWRTQIDDGRWAAESVALRPHSYMSDVTYSRNGDPVFSVSLGVRDVEGNDREVWMNIKEPPASKQRGAPAGPVIAPLRVRSDQGWQRVAVRTAAGHWIRAELRVHPLPLEGSGS